MGLSNEGRNVMLDAFAAVALYVSLHTADPGTAGTDELTGGDPAYARQPVTWHVAAGGNLDNTANPVFDIPPATTITHYGYWSTVTDGTFYGGEELPVPEVYAGQGTYAFTDLDVTL